MLGLWVMNIDQEAISSGGKRVVVNCERLGLGME